MFCGIIVYTNTLHYLYHRGQVTLFVVSLLASTPRVQIAWLLIAVFIRFPSLVPHLFLIDVHFY